MLVYVVVLLAHGLLPGLLPDAPVTYLAEGTIRCLNDLGLSALTSHCHAFGEPTGYPLLTGGPVLALGAVLMYLPGIDSYGAHLISLATFDALALLGGYGLMRRLGAPAAVALGAAAAYLLTPTIIGMAPFGGTFVGFALLPAYAWVDLRLIDEVDRRGGRGLAAAIAAYVAVRTGALFLDGYSFIASLLVGGTLWLQWIVRRDRSLSRKALGAATFIGANAVAVALYQAYVPADFDPNPLAVFRSLGLDLITLVLPSESVWWADRSGLTFDGELWGDGSNSRHNYLGILCLALALAYMLGRPLRREAVAIGTAGAVALVLSLGPSLKVNEERPMVPVGELTFESYLMPEGAATADLPWGDLFVKAPGIDTMRASYRWSAVSRMALIVLAGLAIARLAARRRYGRLAAITLAVLAFAEVAPNLSLYEAAYDRNHDAVAAVRAEVERDLQSATHAGERVFFLSYDGSHNDYMVNFLAAGADLRSYNAGGDKNVAFAQRAWPAEVAALAAPTFAPDAVVAALNSGRLDAVIAPFFHPRWSAYSWPPDRSMRARAKAAFSLTLADQRLDVKRYRSFAVIRLASARSQR